MLKSLKIHKNCNIKRRLLEIVTCDETLIHLFEPQRKIDSKILLTKKTKCHVQQNDAKVQRMYDSQFLFNNDGPVVYVAIPKGRCIQLCAVKVKKHYKIIRPKPGIRNIRIFYDNTQA